MAKIRKSLKYPSYSFENKVKMKHTIVVNIVTICSILFGASNLAMGQCSTTSSGFVPEGLPQGFDSTALTIESIQLPFPTLIEVADSNEVYVFGGQPLALDIFVSAILTGQPGQPNPLYYSQFFPYVVRVDPVTMDTIFLELSGGSGIPYLGGTAKHSNGYLYAIARARLFKIDPMDMSILQTIDMPVQAGQSIIYNGVSIAGNGLLITKSTDLANPTEGQFFMLDPDSLMVLNEIELDAGTARLAFDCDSLGNEYVYHLNQEYTFRMLVTSDSLVVDTTWQAAYDPYGTGINAEPTSPRLLNDIVAYTTNTQFDATEPMKIFWQRTGQSYSRDTDTLRGEFMFSDSLSAGFDFGGLVMNEETEVMVGQDQANGKIAAYRVNEAEKLIYLWEREYAVSGTPFIVATTASTGMVYTNHYDFAEQTAYLIVLDLFTGAELGRIQTPATVPSISQTRAGAYNDFYYCSNESGQLLGYFHRVSLGEETGTTPTTHLTIANEIQVAPNPFENQTLVTWKNKGNAIFHAQLLNVAGQTVRTYKGLRGESFLIEKGGLKSGIYFLQVFDDAGHAGILKLSLL